MQVAHKFNVRSALHYCDTFLSSKADEDPQFFNLGVGLPGDHTSCTPACAPVKCHPLLLRVASAWEGATVHVTPTEMHQTLVLKTLWCLFCGFCAVQHDMHIRMHCSD